MASLLSKIAQVPRLIFKSFLWHAPDLLYVANKATCTLVARWKSGRKRDISEATTWDWSESWSWCEVRVWKLIFLLYLYSNLVLMTKLDMHSSKFRWRASSKISALAPVCWTILIAFMYCHVHVSPCFTGRLLTQGFFFFFFSAGLVHSQLFNHFVLRHHFALPSGHSCLRSQPLQL